MKLYHLRNIAAVLLLAALAVAQNSIPNGYPEDPYLQFRPPFVRSLPVQILLTGVVLTLTVVLFIHLMFTAQYHWPLAPVNYVLQVSAVTTLLISLIATIHVVLSASWAESENWPYMLSYIAVNVPPSGMDDDPGGWSIAEKATWFVMNASTSGLIQITHIQFLTLLYPSRLEKQLIFALLGPMAIVAAIMQLIPINNSDVTYVAGAVRNVCNATLSLLFTVALFIWGLLVNRKQAWRTDGGTAVFGCGALTLALVSTGLNFLYVHREEEYAWLPGLMWAVVLWQSFLGWWWWVGAGSGSGLGGDDDMEEKLRRKAKRENRRREAKELRQETKKRAKKVWRDVTGAFGREHQDTSAVIHNSSVESRPQSPSQRSSIRIRLPAEGPSSVESPRSPTSDTPPGSPTRSVVSTSSSSSLRTLPRALPGAIHQFYASIRRAHLIAAQKQAAERVERIREMTRNGISDNSTSTWGVSNLLWRQRRGEPSAARDADTDVEGDRVEGEYELYERSQWRRRSGGGNDPGGGEGDDDDDGERGREPIGEEEVEDMGGARRHNSERPSERSESDARGEGSTNEVGTATVPTTELQSAPGQSHARPKSIWWWGPLWRWRLQDSTTYS